MTKEKILKIAVPIIATFFVVIAVYAGSTIGSNISTDGNLTVTGTTGLTGLLTFSSATSTSATTTGYLMVGVPFSMPPGFNYNADLAVSGDAVINNKATSTVALWVGSAGTANNINLAGGDLYVQNDAEIDGGLYVNAATTTDSLSIGGYASTTGDLIVFGGTVNLATTSGTTTVGIFSRAHITSTSTISIGDEDRDIPGCLEMVTKAGAYFFCYIDSTAAGNAAFVCNSGRCN